MNMRLHATLRGALLGLVIGVAVALIALSTGCASTGYGGSLEETGRWLAPEGAQFTRELQPHTAANPSPVTVTVVVNGGGGGEKIGQAVDTFSGIPGLGWLVGTALGVGGAAVGGAAIRGGKLSRALTTVMGGLELAPPEVREAVRDRARALGLSSFLESLIASGQVPHVEASPEVPGDASRVAGADASQPPARDTSRRARGDASRVDARRKPARRRP